MAICPLLYSACEGVSDFPFLRNVFACGNLVEEEVEEKKKDICHPQQQRGVSLMAGGGRKSQDLVFDVKLSNSHRHTSDRTVGGRCTATLYNGAGLVISLQKLLYRTLFPNVTFPHINESVVTI